MNAPPAPRAPHSIQEFVEGYEAGRTLRGTRCAACGKVQVTWALACPRCGARQLEEATLSPLGRIVAGTIVRVASDEFVNDAPYAYVLVELDGGGRLAGWIPGVRSLDEIRPGAPVRFAPSYKPGIHFERTSDVPAKEATG